MGKNSSIVKNTFVLVPSSLGLFLLLFSKVPEMGVSVERRISEGPFGYKINSCMG